MISVQFLLDPASLAGHLSTGISIIGLCARVLLFFVPVAHSRRLAAHSCSPSSGPVPTYCLFVPAAHSRRLAAHSCSPSSGPVPTYCLFVPAAHSRWLTAQSMRVSSHSQALSPCPVLARNKKLPGHPDSSCISFQIQTCPA